MGGVWPIRVFLVFFLNLFNLTRPLKHLYHRLVFASSTVKWKGRHKTETMDVLFIVTVDFMLYAFMLIFMSYHYFPVVSLQTCVLLQQWR